MDQTCAIKTESNTCELNSATDPDTFDEATSLDGSGRNNAISLTANSELGRAFCFGTFRLLSTQRLLLNGDRAVRIGSRALDILIALIMRRGQLVTNCELRKLVWPNTLVVEANLTVNIAALRRALGDGQGGSRYIINVPGRGYYFVAPVTFEDTVKHRPAQHPTITLQQRPPGAPTYGFTP